MENLFIAVEKNDLDKIRILLADPGIDINAIDTYVRETVLTTAVVNKHTGLVAYLLAQDNINLHIQGIASGTPLTYAIFSNQHDVAKMLLEKDIKFDSSLHPGAINWAILNGQIELLQLLNKKGANFNLPGLTGRDELDQESYWIWKPEPEPNTTPFHREYLDLISYTPLYLAIDTEQQEILIYLLEKCNVDPNMKNIDGELPLQLAVEQNNKDFVSLLLAHGADPNLPCKTEDQSVPFYLRNRPAIIDPEILNLLEEAKKQENNKAIPYRPGF